MSHPEFFILTNAVQNHSIPNDIQEVHLGVHQGDRLEFLKIPACPLDEPLSRA